MFVTEVSSDDVHQGRVSTITCKAPRWSDVEELIRRLDGERYTLVSLGTDSEAHFCVGGGKTGCYVAYCILDDDVFHNVVGPTPNEPVAMLCGAQKVTYDASDCCDLESVLKAARRFSETGELSEDVIWRTE